MAARDQWRWLTDSAHGQAVGAASLRPGDLLFYTTDSHDPAYIHHVAMYVGHGRMVEAYADGVPIRVTPIHRDGYFGALRPVEG